MSWGWRSKAWQKKNKQTNKTNKINSRLGCHCVRVFTSSIWVVKAKEGFHSFNLIHVDQISILSPTKTIMTMTVWPWRAIAINWKRGASSTPMRSCHAALKRNAKYQGPVVRKRTSAYPGLNFNPGFYISLFKSRYGIIFPISFSAFNHSIVPTKMGLTQIFF